MTVADLQPGDVYSFSDEFKKKEPLNERFWFVISIKRTGTHVRILEMNREGKIQPYEVNPITEVILLDSFRQSSP